MIFDLSSCLLTNLFTDYLACPFTSQPADDAFQFADPRFTGVTANHGMKSVVADVELCLSQTTFSLLPWCEVLACDSLFFHIAVSGKLQYFHAIE